MLYLICSMIPSVDVTGHLVLKIWVFWKCATSSVSFNKCDHAFAEVVHCEPLHQDLHCLQIQLFSSLVLRVKIMPCGIHVLM